MNNIACMPEKNINLIEDRSVIYRTYGVIDLYRVAHEKVAPTRFLEKIG
jgi:hypothetical protein